jgi:hypothetical protein
MGMIKYEVGTRFPHEKYLNRGEVTVPMLHEQFFDVVCVLGNISVNERKDWRKGNLSVYLYGQDNIPFIAFAFDTWNFDVNINIGKINGFNIDTWLNSEANTINLFLVEAITGNLTAMRLISIPSKMAELIRDICEKQTGMDTTRIDLLIQSALTDLPTEYMMKNALMKYKIK